MTEDLGQIIGDAREEARIIGKMGNPCFAGYVVEFLDRVEGAASEYLTWLSEDEARQKSRLSERTLRRRFGYMQSCGLARHSTARRREYRACAIPVFPRRRWLFMDGLVSAKLRREIIARDGELCGICRTTEGPWHVDHRVPRSLGGRANPSNLWVLCARCNIRKRARTVEDYLSDIGGLA